MNAQTSPARCLDPIFSLSALGRLRRWALVSAMCASAPTALAQDEVPPLVDQPGAELDEIVVTGSRIARNGYDTPTPVTVVDEQELETAAPPNLADFVNQLPSVAGSVTPATSNRSLSSGAAGVNTLSLRGLGPSRTLVLLDGHRSVGSLADGTVDINTIPQGLVKNVEIVTGGASATYGSDAVAGVVNFILDRDYTGVKLDANYGETTYGDDQTMRLTLTAGLPFAGGRGHFLFNGQSTRRDGIYGMHREWAEDGVHMTINPAYAEGNGTPQYRVASHSGLNTLTGGGIITSGELRGTYFGSGGTVNQYDYGDDYLESSASGWTIGGDWKQSQHNQYTSLQPEERMDGLFGRLSWQLTEQVEVFAEATWNDSRARQWGGQGTDKGNITIYADNAFLPDSVAQQMAALGLDSFTMGSWNADIPTRTSNNQRTVQRYVLGAEGDVAVFDADWKWDAYYQYGRTEAHEKVHAANRARLAYAQDAVIDPSSGEVVCRAVLEGDADAAGCVPFNRIGIGVNAPGASDWFMGYPQRDQRFEQQVGAVNFSTNLENPWLAPIGVAFGIEHRQESISGSVDEQYQSGWIVGNYLPTIGSYNVSEAYLETLVSLPAGFEFNGAARATRYSESGSVTTWKAGLSWTPVDDVRIRATRSRDIRAPNLTELFQAGTSNTNYVSDPWNSDASTRYTQTVTGNPDLDPEKADTLGLGLVYRPSFLPGFGASLDYYDIKLAGAIDSLSPQDIMDRCASGNTELCQRITAVTEAGDSLAYGSWDNSAGPDAAVSEYLILNSPYNFVEQRARGLDIEVSYGMALGPGDLTLRGLATHYLEMTESNGVDAPVDSVGQNTGGGPPDWIYRLTATYTVNRFTAQLVARGLSAGVYDNTYIECRSSCPESTAEHRTIADNSIDGAFYLDSYLAYNFDATGVPLGAPGMQVWFKINNLLNKDPVPVGLGPSDSSNVEPGINRSFYDYLGRVFRIGLRMEWG